MRDETKRFYDLNAEQTAREWYAQDVLMPTLRDFCSLLPDPPRVLDLGCGAGYESKRLASLGARVVGVVRGEKLRRVIYRYRRDDLGAACARLAYVRDGYLDRERMVREQIAPDWGGYVFQKVEDIAT
jgi:SAM-dependent methyltransferase